LFGNEFDGQQDPFEAGIGFAVPLKTKTDDFIGKENLIKRKENPQKKLVGLELIGKEKANHGDCVHIGRAQIGIVTSACLSPSLGKTLLYVELILDTQKLVLMLRLEKLMDIKKEFQLKVNFPHYDPQKTRVRS
jgi:aminomethyltransferase